MTTLALADVVDLDCVQGFAPLVLDFPAVERYATGGNAIVRRVLYAWVIDGGLLELPGATLSSGGLAILRSRLSRLAEEEDYVKSIALSLSIDPTTNVLAIVAADLALVDGRTYALEVATSGASAAILALGSASA